MTHFEYGRFWYVRFLGFYLRIPVIKGGMNLSPYSEGEIRIWHISTGENWDLIHRCGVARESGFTSAKP